MRLFADKLVVNFIVVSSHYNQIQLDDVINVCEEFLNATPDPRL